jgi:hypothetical protein
MSCPECNAPAEITERFSLPSTDGPVSHVALHCAAGHHFRMPADKLPARAQEQLAQPELAQPEIVGRVKPLVAER